MLFGVARGGRFRGGSLSQESKSKMTVLRCREEVFKLAPKIFDQVKIFMVRIA